MTTNFYDSTTVSCNFLAKVLIGVKFPRNVPHRKWKYQGEMKVYCTEMYSSAYQSTK